MFFSVAMFLVLYFNTYLVTWISCILVLISTRGREKERDALFISFAW
uniref:Uncharacterized protein n=1 Tax=Rhizophora mucronata TaxID=61149 RepID=A0A2P2NXM3_RHIMU